MKSYKETDIEIQKLLKSISKKSKKFATADHESKFYGDLEHVFAELKDINDFLR